MDLRLARVAEPLHLTDRHRLYSAAPGTHRVFNIEAESEHCFFAGRPRRRRSKEKGATEAAAFS